MASRGRAKERRRLLPGAVKSGLRRLMLGTYGLGVVTVACAAWASLATWSVHDPSFNDATRAAPRNLLGGWGAVVAALAIQSLGLASIFLFLPLAAWGLHLLFRTVPKRRRLRLLAWPAAVILLAATLSALPQPKSWPLPNGLGGIFGDFFMAGAHVIGPFLPEAAVSFVAGLVFFVFGTILLLFACGTSTSRLIALWAPRSSAATEWASAWIGGAMHFVMQTGAKLGRIFARRRRDEQDDYEDEDTQAEEFVEEEPQVDADGRIEPSFGAAPFVPASEEEDNDEDGAENVNAPGYRITRTAAKEKKKHTGVRSAPMEEPYETPSIKLLQQARSPRGRGVSDDVLQENARELEGVLQDFGVKGEITNVRPGPVVTLYELEPAPGTKSSRVDRACRRHRPLDERHLRPRGRGAWPQRHRHRAAQRPPRNCAACASCSNSGLSGRRGKAWARAWQEYRRRADHRRPVAHAASSHRRHHRLGQVGRHQHHDPVAAVPAVARAVQIHHDRSEDARAVGL